jgi:hypothetical protein
MAFRQHIKIIRWGAWFVGAYGRLPVLELDHCPPILEDIHWGPQHVDLPTQDLLRRSFHRGAYDRLTDFECYLEALRSGDEVIFWCDPSLGSCLAILWVLDTLSGRGADWRNAYLLLSAEMRVPQEPNLTRQAFEARIAVAETLQPLIAIRRHLASDSEVVRADLSRLPPPVRDWVAISNRLEEFLPDERGLDLVDQRILDALMEGSGRRRNWFLAASVIGSVLDSLEADDLKMSCDIGSGHVWDRLLELADVLAPWRRGPYQRELIEIQFGEELAPRFTHVRIGQIGKKVRAGQLDALQHCGLARWVGGRLICRERPLRRSTMTSAHGSAGPIGPVG